mgnify:CR=1 FL=1
MEALTLMSFATMKRTAHSSGTVADILPNKLKGREWFLFGKPNATNGSMGEHWSNGCTVSFKGKTWLFWGEVQGSNFQTVRIENARQLRALVRWACATDEQRKGMK